MGFTGSKPSPAPVIIQQVPVVPEAPVKTQVETVATDTAADNEKKKKQYQQTQAIATSAQGLTDMPLLGRSSAGGSMLKTRLG